MSTKENSTLIPLKDQKIVDSGGYSIFEWSPDEDHACGPTQVHLMLPLDSIIKGASIALRLKSRRAIQELIDFLVKYRDSVWPPH